MRHFVILRSNQLTAKPIAVGRTTRPIMATDAAEKILTAVNAGATRRCYYSLSAGSQACDMQLDKLQINQRPRSWPDAAFDGGKGLTRKR